MHSGMAKTRHNPAA